VTARTTGFACVSPTVVVQANQTLTADISCVAEVGGDPLPSPPTAPPTGKIAFERAGRILVVAPDGGNGYTLIDGLAPSWSADGRKLVFQRPACLDWSLPPYTNCDDVWRMNADGSGLSPITNYEWVLDQDPVWSPDGSRVAFVRFVHGPDQSYVVVANADPPSRLWSEIVLSAWWPISRPTWSPDGTRIAFTCEGGLPPRPGFDICVVSSGGNRGYSGGQLDIDKLMNDAWSDSDPAWSPDGAWIAFTTNRESTDGRSSVAIIRPDGGGFTRLAPGSRPAWSPDGSRIVFVGEADSPGLHVVNADGSRLIRITDDPADYAPSWGR
jgi:Tol biopolymer transport system component